MNSPIFQEEEDNFKRAHIERSLSQLHATKILLEKLSSSTDLNHILHATIEALRASFSSQCVSYLFNDPGNEGISLCYVYTTTPLRNDYFPTMLEEMRTFIHNLPQDLDGRQAIETLLSQRHPLFEVVEGAVNDETGQLPKLSHFIPFIFNEQLHGIVCVGFTSEVPLSKEIKDNIDTIVSCAALNFSRMHSLIEIENKKSLEVAQLEAEFISVASHQLRTPLTTIIWSLEMLLSGDVGELTPEQKETVQTLFDNSKKLTTLVNDLLNTSRLGSGRLRVDPKPIKIVPFIEEAVAQVREFAERAQCQIEINTPDQESIPEIPLDETLIAQSIHNLLTNAIRYSPDEGGKIVVSLEKQDDQCVITVADDGIGVPLDQQDNLFTKFFRADNARTKETEGTGLGLHLVKMIADLAGGSVWVDSPKSDGKGSAFHLSLPWTGMQSKEGEVDLAK